MLLVVPEVWVLMLLINNSGTIECLRTEKNMNMLTSKLPHGQILPAKEALAKVKEFAYAKFDETVDVDVNLGIDASKGEQVVRGSVVLPHGTRQKG